jgi:hypothetical protein
LCKYYAALAAVTLIGLGLAGFFVVDLGCDPLTNAYHLTLGLFFGYISLSWRDREQVRQMVVNLGVLLVAVKEIEVSALYASGHNLVWGPIEVTCFMLGITSILACRYLRDASP